MFGGDGEIAILHDREVLRPAGIGPGAKDWRILDGRLPLGVFRVRSGYFWSGLISIAVLFTSHSTTR
jgi:hypothetical protein